MSAAAVALVLLVQVQLTDVPLGVPVVVDYSIPGGLEPLPLESSSDFAVLEQNGDSVTIVPLALDTLDLPPMTAVSDTGETLFPPPLVTVARTMPDTAWTVPVFTSPIGMNIPPGYPRDYLERHRFWMKWKGSPSRTWLKLLILGLALAVAGLIAWMLRRRRAAATAGEETVSRPGVSPLDEVRALLDSRAFAEGRWHEYYRDVDRLLRDTVAFRFGIGNRAYTWRQIAGELSSEADGRRFVRDTEELTREITLQRYAGWGGSRDRAGRFTEKLLSIRKEWHGK
ncbi:MAG: hypothetical protein R6U39_00200 [Candidatus Aegiribacteria sp.]